MLRLIFQYRGTAGAALTIQRENLQLFSAKHNRRVEMRFSGLSQSEWW
jgi:hypothetical protein